MIKFGNNVEEVRKVHIPDPFVRFQFTSKRKRMSTVINKIGQSEHNHDARLHMKGAAEIVLDCCNTYLNEKGDKVPLSDSTKQEFLNTINHYASQSLRTISFCYRDLKANEGGANHDKINDGDYLYEVEKAHFTLVGIVGIKDVIRPEVPEAITLCKRAGITVRMVTGDNLITAKAIARECGILSDDLIQGPDCIMEGPEFYRRMGGLVCRTCK